MITVEKAHNDIIHDAKLDYFSKRLASCSSDKTIKIFDIDGNECKHIKTLIGHTGLVWQIAWAHPKFGSILASCSYDGKVFIWKEQNDQQWSIIAEHAIHKASVNSVSWAPHEIGAVLLCTSSDGNVSVVDFNEDGTISHVMFEAHFIGVKSASWAPLNNTSFYSKDYKQIKQQRRFVTCGMDKLAKIWKYDESKNKYINEATLEGHEDWVYDVSWSPSILIGSYIATASKDCTVLIWSQDSNGKWQKQFLTEEKFPEICWKCSWSLSGNLLAVSDSNKITLWKENLQGKWELAGDVNK